jgi:tetratricopeptide (TPR) repeat protein
MASTTDQGAGTAVSPLARALGIGEAELDVVGQLFVEAASDMGVDGLKIFARLKKGEPLGRALSIPPGVAELLYARAHQWFLVGRPDAAEPLFRTLCVIDGGTADYWVGYGICLRGRQAWSEAIIAFETATRLRPEWEVPHFHALELFMRRETWARAADELAAFEANAGPETPTVMTTDAARFRTALDLRRTPVGQGSVAP